MSYTRHSLIKCFLFFSDQPTYKVDDLKDFLQRLAQNNLQKRGPLLGLIELSKVTSMIFFL